MAKSGKLKVESGKRKVEKNTRDTDFNCHYTSTTHLVYMDAGLCKQV